MAAAAAAVVVALAAAEQRSVIARLDRTPGSLSSGAARAPMDRAVAASRVLSACLVVALAAFAVWLHRCALVARRLTGRQRWASWTAYLSLLPLTALVVVPVHATDAWRAGGAGGPGGSRRTPVLLWWGGVVVLLGGVALSGLAVPTADALDPARQARASDAGLALAEALVAVALVLTAGFVVALTRRLRRRLRPVLADGMRPSPTVDPLRGRLMV